MEENSIKDMFSEALDSAEDQTGDVKSKTYFSNNESEDNRKEDVADLEKTLIQYIDTELIRYLEKAVSSVTYSSEVIKNFPQLKEETKNSYIESIVDYLKDENTNEVSINELKDTLLQVINQGVEEFYSDLINQIENEKREMKEKHDTISNELAKEKSLEFESQNSTSNSHDKDLETTILTIRILDNYREQDEATTESINSFFETKDEALIINKVLNEKKSTRKALNTIMTADEKDQVDRAFYLMSLPDNLLLNMGKILTPYLSYDPLNTSISNDKIEYCRKLENLIENMTTSQSSNLKAISDLLQISIT